MTILPSGRRLHMLSIEHDLLLLGLPKGEKDPTLRDLAYLKSFAQALGLSGIALSIGDFTRFIAVAES